MEGDIMSRLKRIVGISLYLIIIVGFVLPFIFIISGFIPTVRIGATIVVSVLIICQVWLNLIKLSLS